MLPIPLIFLSIKTSKPKKNQIPALMSSISHYDSSAAFRKCYNQNDTPIPCDILFLQGKKFNTTDNMVSLSRIPDIIQ